MNMNNKFTKEEIYEELKNILIDDFEIDEDKIVPEANLFEDLEFDSIDAVDLAVRLQDFTKQKISPENFKQIKTINDVVDAVDGLLQ